MGFQLEKDNSSDNSQLNFFDYQLPKADFSTTSAVDYNSFLMAHSEPETNKTSRFMTVSAAVHAAAILLIAMMSVPLVEQAKTETITIEIEDTPSLKVTRGNNVPATQGSTPALAETPVVTKAEDAGGPQDIVVAKAPATPKTSVAKSPKVSAPKNHGAAKTAGKSIAAKTNFKAVPMTIDDIEAPELDQGALANTNVASTMSEDFNEDFDRVSQTQRAALDNEKKSLDAMAAALETEQDDNLNSLDKLNQAEASKLAAAQDNLRKKNAAAIASALASERAAALAAAQEAAARKAATKAGLGGNGNGFGAKTGDGAGNSGVPTSGSQLAGMPKGIRSLDQLRQMPGNPRPQYDREERRRGDQGKVTFIAYISKAGYPSQFKMLSSTGFRNLDAKTLAALKKWRFYPGQEGWVELPFRWDLKGGLQEDGGLLRRSVTSR